MIKRAAALVALSMWSLPAGAAEGVFRSAPGGTSLLELYSSEGCSSCPPADAWLSALRREPGLWTDFVPVAFHVDYWDYLGWRDELASPEFTARQQSYGRLLTPELLLNGRPLSGRSAAVLAKPKSDAGALELRSDGASGVVRFKANGSDAGGLTAHAVLIGFDVASSVSRGENGGRVLRHDFVVLAHERQPLKNGRAAFLFKKNLAARAGRLGVAAWVSRGDDPAPLQAAGGYLKQD